MVATFLLLLATRNPPMISEFIFDHAPFASCHASTIEETTSGELVAAWFGGTHEGASDVGIYFSRRVGVRWLEPVEVAKPEGGQPCWNPVLFQPRNGPLLLFFKVGPSPSRWWGMMTSSSDDGETWLPPHRLPDGILGPIKDKPIELAEGTILCPSSREENGWTIHFESTSDLGQTWTLTEPLNDPAKVAAIQPTILRIGEHRFRALLRTKQHCIYAIDSTDDGKTWANLHPLDLPNPDSGIDAVTLKDGRHLLVYNDSMKKRTPLCLALSDDGEHWRNIRTLEAEKGEYSYPAVIQTRYGQIHITYTWNRTRIKHVDLRED